ncbi:MAG: hypothetical protein EBS06_00130 [Proteobacteria bacterium]|nr:hypothetical protein [Pseudomonadota bacterium]
MSQFFNQNQIEKIISLALEAGEIAVNFQKSNNFEIIKKADNTSVTSADITISEFINKNLSQDFPDIPIICEEGKLRQANDIFWLIDPIDGTSSFIDGSNEFAINIALIKNRKAIFGLIYAPLFQSGKMIFSNHQDEVILQNKNGRKRILPFKKSVQNSLRIITSPRTKDHEIKNYIAQFRKNFLDNFVVERLSSAIKFFRILENDADLYLHFRPSMEWDSAAGQALIELMNGRVKTMSLAQDKIFLGDELIYKKDNFLNQSFVTFIN